MNCALFKNCAPKNRASIRLRSVACKVIALFFGKSESGGERIVITLAAPDDAAIRFANAGCGFDEGVEHHLQIECGTADDLEHVGGGGLLLEIRAAH